MRSSQRADKENGAPRSPPDAPASVPSCWLITAFPACVILPQMNHQPMCIWMVKPPFTQYISKADFRGLRKKKRLFQYPALYRNVNRLIDTKGMNRILGKPLKTRGSGTLGVAGIPCLVLPGRHGSGSYRRPQWSQV